MENYSIGCNATTGACLCKAGLQGTQCNEPCQKGTWGPSCINRCSCSTGMTCDTVTGRCHRDCPAGWTAEKCDQRMYSWNAEFYGVWVVEKWYCYGGMLGSIEGICGNGRTDSR